LRVIAGLTPPDAGGRVLFDGADVTRVPIEKRKVGMVFQSYALFPNMTVAENVGYGLKIQGLSSRERAKRVSEMLELTSIEALRDRSIDQLSGGQRQRVALARAVAVHPRVLLLDEPLTALDASLRDRLRTDLNLLLRTLGITAVYVTHDQAEAMALGDRIVVMSNGAIAQQGTPEEIYFRPASRFVAEFIGAANVLESGIEGGRLLLPGGYLPTKDAPDARQAIAMVRPEAIRVTDPQSATLKGRIQTASFLGDRLRVTVAEAAAQPIVVDAPNDLQLTPGQQVGLSVDSSSVRLLQS
jgi:putative spermidine/putrescine transport system ATP-binding protein